MGCPAQVKTTDRKNVILGLFKFPPYKIILEFRLRAKLNYSTSEVYDMYDSTWV